MSKDRHVLDVWVCQGRMCTAQGSDPIEEAVQAAVGERADGERVRVLRGGCFGLCDFAPNVVVRRYSAANRRPPTEDDRLSLTKRRNETVYSCVEAASVPEILASHLDEDQPLEALTYERLEEQAPETNDTHSGIRKLRRSVG